MISLLPHPRRSAQTAVVLVSILLSVLLPATANAAEKGIETDLTWGVSNSDQDKTVAGVQDLGATWMRLTMAWHDIETAKGSYSMLAKYDTAIDKAAAAGTKIVVTVYTSPQWASGSANQDSPPTNPQDYADFMRFAASRWGDKVEAWEVWNEQNLRGFWSTGPNPAAYARLLQAAYPAIKQADPTASVVYGGVSYNDYRFLEGAYAAVPNLGDYYDVMASHPYSPNHAPEQVWYDSDGRIAKQSFASYREIRKVMLAHGDDKPLWFTEFGWSTNTLLGWGVTEAQQADYYTRAMRCVEQDPYVQVAIWYLYRNHAWANDANTWVDQLGLTRTDFSHKPAYDSFKNYTPGNTGCTYNYPPATPTPELPELPVEPTTEPDPTEEPAEPVTEPEPEGEIESSSVRRRVGLRVLRPARSARTARNEESLPPRRMDVVGRVSNADRGRIALRLTCHGRADNNWHRVVRKRTAVNRSGRFERQIRPRRKAACVLRAEYHVGGDNTGRSRRVRFKT